MSVVDMPPPLDDVWWCGGTVWPLSSMTLTADRDESSATIYSQGKRPLYLI